MSIRVLLVDNQEMICMGFRMALGTVEDIEIAGETSDGDETLDVLAKHSADVVLMDVRMPRIDGIKATRHVMALEDPSHVLVLTTFDLGEYAYEALRAGASGFPLEGVLLEEAAVAIRHVHDGDAVVVPSTTRRPLSHPAAPEASSLAASTNTVPLESLTPREREVLGLVACGLPSREIADEFVLSEGTVRVHVGHVLTKLDLRDRAWAVALAYGTGLVTPGSVWSGTSSMPEAVGGRYALGQMESSLVCGSVETCPTQSPQET